jgi:hypothetical protein
MQTGGFESSTPEDSVMTDTQIGAFLRECVLYEEDSEEGLDFEAL